MNDKQLKLIYEYMGWKIINYELEFDSNLAYECVQEMERKGDWEDFIYYCPSFIWSVLGEEQMTKSNFILWLFNPNNFWNCFAKWLEVRNDTHSSSK